MRPQKFCCAPRPPPGRTFLRPAPRAPPRPCQPWPGPSAGWLGAGAGEGAGGWKGHGDAGRRALGRLESRPGRRERIAPWPGSRPATASRPGGRWMPAGRRLQRPGGGGGCGGVSQRQAGRQAASWGVGIGLGRAGRAGIGKPIFSFSLSCSLGKPFLSFSPSRLRFGLTADPIRDQSIRCDHLTS